jgi:tetratricopeptide (TPR) repeat protein/predicted Ser/Thr protein kinase
LDCPDDNALTGWLRRSLPEAQQRDVGTHVQSCAACTALVEELAASFAEDAPAQSIGRYVVLRPLGSGGFGVVYLAWDPQLDRQVALKVLRPVDRDAEVLAAELLREAKAMAKLSHPNVTAVYDVAALDGQVAIAMELIDGTNAREWLAEKPRTQREILDVFLAAARGLQAAHAAGLVHRDFKPENVLVGRDGRVAVTDFGLARPETAAGARSGTPKYMAPEQKRGEAVDARADQYSLAVALSEALKDPPRPLKRALSEDRAQRFPDMAAFIAAVAPPRRSPWLRGAVAAAIVLTPLAGAYSWSRARDALCSGAPARVAAIWPQAVRDQVDPTAAKTMTAWLDRWAAQSTEACEATRIRGEQPDDVLAARMSCFDRLHDQARATIEALRQATDSRAVQLPALLDPPDRCLDAGPLLREEKPPEAQRGAIRQLRFELEQLRAARNLGRFDSTSTLLARAEELAYAPLLAEVRLFDGETQSMLGHTAEAEAALTAAVHDAVRGRSDRTAADAWIALVLLKGLTPRGSEAWREAASSAAERVPADKVIHGRLCNALGLSLAAAGRLQEALELQRDAVATMASVYGSEAPQVGPQRHKVAELLVDLGYYDGARGEAERSLQAITAAFGASHPLTSLPLTVLAQSACLRGEYAECERLADQATAVRVTATTPEDHPTFIPKYLLAAIARRGLGQPSDALFDRAESLARKAQDDAWLGRVLAERGGLDRSSEATRLLRGALGDDNPDTWRAQRAHAEALIAAGRAAEALSELKLIEEKISQRFDPNSPLLARVLLDEARAGGGDDLRQRAARLVGSQDPLTERQLQAWPRPSP